MRLGAGKLLLGVFGAAVAVFSTLALSAGNDDYPTKDTVDASVYRGSVVFINYCAACHGVAADGNGRKAKLYNPKPANLILSDKNDTYKEMIIRRGGEAMGRSSFMPPWGDELTNEQVRDVIAYLRALNQCPCNKQKKEGPE